MKYQFHGYEDKTVLFFQEETCSRGGSLNNSTVGLLALVNRKSLGFFYILFPTKLGNTEFLMKLLRWDIHN